MAFEFKVVIFVDAIVAPSCMLGGDLTLLEQEIVLKKIYKKYLPPPPQKKIQLQKEAKTKD